VCWYLFEFELTHEDVEEGGYDLILVSTERECVVEVVPIFDADVGNDLAGDYW
jgi:hypothetical protein